jgi:hypothetical protein
MVCSTTRCNGRMSERRAQERNGETNTVTFRLTGAALMALLSIAGIGRADDDHRDPAWVDERVDAAQPTADERRIDRIGWARDIRSALRLGREHGRPVFLFTMDGRFSIGRC